MDNKEEIKCKYNVGDKVKIVNYGSLFWWNKEQYIEQDRYIRKWRDEEINLMWGKDYVELPLPKRDENSKPSHILGETKTLWITDMNPNYIGQEGIISEATIAQNKPQYAIEGTTKHAWWYEDQLELINKNPNNEQ